MLRRLVVVLILFGMSNIYADIVSVNPRPRMQAMGGAGAATLGDRDSAMMNPAGLNDVESGHIEAFPLTLEVPFDLDLLQSGLDYYDIQDNSASTIAQKQDALAQFLRDSSSSAEAIRFNFYPSYTRKHWHFGLLVDGYVEPKISVGGMTANQLGELGGSSATVGAILGTGWGFLEDSLQVGLTVKPLYRMAAVVNKVQTIHDVVKGKNTTADADGTTPSVANELFGKDKLDNRAYAVGIDLGVKYRIPFLENLKPTVALTYQDIGNTRFLGDQDLPADIPQSLSAGIAIQPDWGIFRNTVAFDFRNINKQEELLNKIHFGMESIIWNLVALRAGISQGYLTGGVGLLLKIFEMDVFVANREADTHANTHSITTLGVRLAFGW
jgi:hypothetical protein